MHNESASEDYTRIMILQGELFIYFDYSIVIINQTAYLFDHEKPLNGRSALRT